MCPSLKKLSLQGLRISNQIFTHYISAKKTLTHLNLFACSGIIFIKNPKLNSKYVLAIAQCSKWYEISDMDIFQITEENPDPPTNQGAYFNILLSI